MSERKVYREFVLNVRHYEGEQTVEEMLNICDKCLLRDGKACKLFDLPTSETQRMCINNYRIDRETLVDAMQEKVRSDNDAWNKWIASYKDYMGEDESLVILKEPDDIIKVHDKLEKMGV